MISLDSIVYIVVLFCITAFTIATMVAVQVQGDSMPSRFRFNKGLIVAGALIIVGYAVTAAIVGNMPGFTFGLKTMFCAIEALTTVNFAWEYQKQVQYINQHPQYATK